MPQGSSTPGQKAESERRAEAAGPSFSARLVRLAADLGVTGMRILDLQIGLCALDGGATELWSHDRGFVKIPGLVLHDPLPQE